MIRTRTLGVLLVGALVLGACGGDDPAASPDDGAADTTTDAATTPATDPTTQDTGEDGAAAGATVDTASTDLGEILVDGDGMTLYLFDNDTEGESVCTDDCAATWPPLIGEPEVAGNADASLVGTITRPDGATQVTYDGQPLYLYAPDSEPGDVTGQGVGGVWWVVGPDGSRITAEAAGTGRPNY